MALAAESWPIWWDIHNNPVDIEEASASLVDRAIVGAVSAGTPWGTCHASTDEVALGALALKVERHSDDLRKRYGPDPRAWKLGHYNYGGGKAWQSTPLLRFPTRSS